MNSAPLSPGVSDYDESLVDWFLSLSPTERLAELESRVAFFKQVRRDGERELPSNPRASPANGERLRKALAVLDARYREHTSLRPTTADLEAGGHLLMTSAGPLDVLGFIGGGKRFEDVAASADAMSIGDISVRVLSLQALIEEKRALGRDKDRAALKILEAVLERRNAT